MKPSDHAKKPRQQRVMEHAEETENGGFVPEERENGPAPREATRGGEPPRPVQPATEPGVPNRQHR